MTDITKQARKQLMNVIEPVLGEDVVRLGLINKVEVFDDGSCVVTMPDSVWGRPLAPAVGDQISDKLRELPGVSQVTIDMVWPPVRFVMKIKALLNGEA